MALYLILSSNRKHHGRQPASGNSPYRCDLPPRGWYCKLPRDHGGPCPTYPSWWNLKWRWKMRGY